MEEIEPVVTEKYEFEQRDQLIIITPVSNWCCPDFDAKKLMIKYSIKFSSPSVFFIGTVMKEIKRVNTEEK